MNWIMSWVKKITKTQIAGWLVAGSMVIVAITPELTGAPGWVTKTLGVAGATIFALLHSPLFVPTPKPPEV